MIEIQGLVPNTTTSPVRHAATESPILDQFPVMFSSPIHGASGYTSSRHLHPRSGALPFHRAPDSGGQTARGDEVQTLSFSVRVASSRRVVRIHWSKSPDIVGESRHTCFSARTTRGRRG